MSLSNSRLAYRDCFDFLDAALADPKGARIRLPYNIAVHFRMRCNNARSIERKENSLTYAPGDPRHGTSAYDAVRINVIRRTEDGLDIGYVYATPWAIDSPIEPLSSLDSDPILDSPDVPLRLQTKPQPPPQLLLSPPIKRRL